MQLVNDYFRAGDDGSEVKSIEFSGTFRCYGSEDSASSASQSGFFVADVRLTTTRAICESRRASGSLGCAIFLIFRTRQRILRDNFWSQILISVL